MVKYFDLKNGQKDAQLRMKNGRKKTPAEQAGIKLDLGQNKIESLIKLASKRSR